MILTLKTSENIIGLMQMTMSNQVDMNDYLKLAYQKKNFKTSGYRANIKYT